VRVLHLVIILAVVGVLVLAGLAFFDKSPIPALNEMAWSMKGYGLAKTPDEALDRFKKALEARNYEAASRFLEGDFQVQFRKVAKPASRLAEATDNFRHAGTDRGYIDAQVDAILYSLEPFPKTVTVKDVKKSEGGDTATALITSDTPSHSIPQGGLAVTLKKKEDVWRLDIPLTPDWRAYLDGIEKYGQQYTNALDTVKTRMKTDATTKGDVQADLKKELEEVKKQ
jgi:hypothetical protein